MQRAVDIHWTRCPRRSAAQLRAFSGHGDVRRLLARDGGHGRLPIPADEAPGGRPLRQGELPVPAITLSSALLSPDPPDLRHRLAPFRDRSWSNPGVETGGKVRARSCYFRSSTAVRRHRSHINQTRSRTYETSGRGRTSRRTITDRHLGQRSGSPPSRRSLRRRSSPGVKFMAAQFPCAARVASQGSADAPSPLPR